MGANCDMNNQSNDISLGLDATLEQFEEHYNMNQTEQIIIISNCINNDDINHIICDQQSKYDGIDIYVINMIIINKLKLMNLNVNVLDIKNVVLDIQNV